MRVLEQFYQFCSRPWLFNFLLCSSLCRQDAGVHNQRPLVQSSVALPEYSCPSITSMLPFLTLLEWPFSHLHKVMHMYRMMRHMNFVNWLRLPTLNVCHLSLCPRRVDCNMLFPSIPFPVSVQLYLFLAHWSFLAVEAVCLCGDSEVALLRSASSLSPLSLSRPSQLSVIHRSPSLIGGVSHPS